MLYCSIFSIVFYCVEHLTALHYIVAPGKQLTEGDRVNRTCDHLQLTVQREKIMYRERKYKEIHTKKYRNKRHCKQSGENTKMGEIDTNKYRKKRHHKHK